MTHSDHPPPIKSLLSLKPHLWPQVCGWQLPAFSHSPFPKVPHPLHQYVWLRPSPTLYPISLDSGLLLSLSGSAEQWLLIGGWDREGSFGSIYRDSLIYQNNNNPPPQGERETAKGLLVSHLRGSVHTIGHTLFCWIRWLLMGSSRNNTICLKLAYVTESLYSFWAINFLI